MLIEFYGQNFGCFREEFRLSMLATDLDRGNDRGVMEVNLEGDDEPLRLLRAAAIYGPNASGKSTVIRAAGVLGNLIAESANLRSDSPLEAYEPFALGAARNMPVRLGTKAVIDQRVYNYEIQYDRTRFVSERLEWIKPDGSSENLIDRTGQEVDGTWKEDKRFSLMAQDFRPNALLFSLADRLAPALAQNIAVAMRRLLSRCHNQPNVGFRVPSTESAAQRISDNPGLKAWLLPQLQAADLGVVDLTIHTKKSKDLSALLDSLDQGDAGNIEHPGSANDAWTFRRLELIHRGADGVFPLPYRRESAGTCMLINLAPLLYDLEHGDDSPPKAAFVDEIDTSLHPELLKGLIRHFNCEIPMAKARGQLIFTAHETSLMDTEAKHAVLRRDQIYFTEKNDEGAARLYSLAEFKERNNLNLRRRYLQGRYGALPSLGTFGE